MIITFSFNDQEPGDLQKAERMQKAMSFVRVIQDIQEEIRACIKHGELTPEKEAIYEEIQELVNHALFDNDVHLTDLYIAP